MTFKYNIPIVVGTCQKYQPVFQDVYQSIKASFPNKTIMSVSDFEINLGENDCMMTMKDEGWNANILKLIEDFTNESYVILTMDDLLFTKCVTEAEFDAVIHSLINSNYDYVSLYAPPAVKLKRAIISDFLPLSNISKDHSISTMVSLIRVQMLRHLLMSTKNPWEFERESSKFINGYKCANLNYNLVNVSNLIVQGKKVTWRNASKTITLIDRLHSLKYGFKVMMHSAKHLYKVKLFQFFLK